MMFAWLNSCDVPRNGYLPNRGKLVLNLMSIPCTHVGKH
jgi:hypothetical protein